MNPQVVVIALLLVSVITALIGNTLGDPDIQQVGVYGALVGVLALMFSGRF